MDFDQTWCEASLQQLPLKLAKKFMFRCTSRFVNIGNHKVWEAKAQVSLNRCTYWSKNVEYAHGVRSFLTQPQSFIVDTFGTRDTVGTEERLVYSHIALRTASTLKSLAVLSAIGSKYACGITVFLNMTPIICCRHSWDKRHSKEWRKVWTEKCFSIKQQFWEFGAHSDYSRGHFRQCWILSRRRR